MNKQFLYTIWGALFAACAVLGFIDEAEGFARVLLVCVALAFFVPPALLLYRSDRTHDRHCAALVRNLAAASLILTCVLLVANFLSVMGSEALGNLLYSALIVVSAPMACGRYWIGSLFCWACLLFAGNHILKKLKTRT
ncbi:MAG: hypothetical protein IJZ39_13610 [Oscillospiraceae bacterium]|nr:hypothetical protein [Oscillospiraceae bacterium]MBQ8239168.1 hypothetical protein [Oscillospiraceae bacterium]